MLYLRKDMKISRKDLRGITGGRIKESFADRLEKKGPKNDQEDQEAAAILLEFVERFPRLPEFLTEGTASPALPAEAVQPELPLTEPTWADVAADADAAEAHGVPITEESVIPCGPCAAGHHIACRNFSSGNTLNGVCCDGYPVTTTTEAGTTAGDVERNTQAPPVIIPLIDDEPYDVLSGVLPGGGEAPFLISNGQRASWERCKRKWWLSWYRELAPQVENLTGALATGDRIHRALAAWYVPDEETPQDPRDALERIIVEDWTKMLRSLGREPGEEGEYEDAKVVDLAKKFHDANTLERAMIAGYVEWLAETGADAEYEILGSEVTLFGDLKDEKTDTVVRVIGRLDARLRRRADGVRLFIDHKTAGSLTDKLLTLPQNAQMAHYRLVEWLNTPEGEARCDGALYNMLKKVRRSDRAQPPFYERLEVPHNVHEINAYRRRLLRAYRDILAATQALDAGENPLDVVPPTTTDDCRWDCPYFAVCRLFDDGSRAEDALEGLYVQVDPLERYDRLALSQ
jgi:hypothetical protein